MVKYETPKGYDQNKEFFMNRAYMFALKEDLPVEMRELSDQWDRAQSDPNAEREYLELQAKMDAEDAARKDQLRKEWNI